MLMLGWGLAAALGAVAGSLVIPTTTALTAALDAGDPRATRSRPPRSAASTARVGAVVGGLIVGVAQRADHRSTSTRSTASSSLVPFGLILVVLLFRPAGLFGKVHVERV